MTRKMAQIGGANVVWDAEDDGNAGKHCAVRLRLPGNSAVCYRLPVPQLIWGMSGKCVKLTLWQNVPHYTTEGPHDKHSFPSKRRESQSDRRQV
jgi:hypothetical protein